MPRRRSDDKRSAILRAAISVIAERGLSSAPTVAISKAAGIAEGTLFTYFATKHDLANALYLDIKQSMAEAMFRGVPQDADFEQSMRHHWNNFIRWGVAEPQALQVMEQLASSGMLTAETTAAGSAPFAALEQFIRDAIRKGTLRKLPFDFLTSSFEAIAQNTIRQIHLGKGNPATLRRLGFEMLWRAIAE